MRVAVVGGTGFIGRETVARLVAHEAEVLVIHRGKTQAPLPAEVSEAKADRMDEDALAAALDSFQPETVIDVLAMTEANTLPVLRAVSGRAERYVLISSADVYGNYGGLIGKEKEPPITRALREDDPLREVRYPYRGNAPEGADDMRAFLDQYDKIVVEALARSELDLETTVLRLPMVFGPGDGQHRFAWMVKAARAGGRAQIDERIASWRATHGYVTDMAEGIALAATDPRAHGKTYNLGRADTPTMAQWLGRVAKVLGVSLKIDVAPSGGLLADMAEGIHTKYPLVLDTGRIRSELEYREIVPEDEALRRTIEWEEQGG